MADLLERLEREHVEAAQNEHGSIRQMLDRLREEGTDTPGFGALVAAPWRDRAPRLGGGARGVPRTA